MVKKDLKYQISGHRTTKMLKNIVFSDKDFTANMGRVQLKKILKQDKRSL